MSVVAASPSVDDAAAGRRLPIILQLDDDNATVVYTRETFQYRDEPLFFDIQPRNHLVESVSHLLTPADAFLFSFSI